jgi:hypothetical protein
LVGALGCGAPDAEPLADGALPPPIGAVVEASTQGIAGLYAGLAGEVEVSLTPIWREGTVLLLASRDTAAQPTCLAPGSACLELARPFIEVGRGPTSSFTASFDFDPSAMGLAVGDEVVFQAFVLRADGRPWASSAPVRVVVEQPAVGCKFDGSPDYDPTQPFSGPCVCPERVVATTAAELAAVAGCAVLGEVRLEGYVDDVAELPALVYANRLVVMGGPGPVTLRAPLLRGAWTYPGSVSLYDAPRLEVVELPAWSGARLFGTFLPALRDLRLDGMVAGGLGLTEVGLGELRLPAWVDGWELRLDRMPQLARVEAPALARLGDAAISRVDTLGELSFPSLVEADEVILTGGASLHTLSLPLLEVATYLEAQGAPNLATWSTPALREVVGVGIAGPSALTAFSLPALVATEELVLTGHPALASVSVPALGDSDWQATFRDNPALCVTAEPIFAAPPPGCSATGSGNLCDP